MERLYFFVIVALIFSFNKAIAIDVVEVRSGFTLQLSEYSTSYNSETNRFEINGMPRIFVNKNKSIFYDVIEFYVASKDANLVVIGDLQFEQKQLEINSDLITDNISSFTKIERVGTQRGVDIVKIIINPFEISSSENAKSLQFSSITVDLGIDISSINNPLSSSESGFFSHIINKKQIPAIRELYKSKKSSPFILSESNWYKPNFDYIKVQTSHDAITKISASEIISLNPTLSGKDIKYFHLINHGESVPIYFSDNNGVLSSDDNLYFLGKHPKGDTTWWDNYSKYEAFFLFYDESTPGLRLANLGSGNVPSYQEIDKVKIDWHLEKENHFYWNEDHDTRHVYTQLWFWDIIRPKELAPGNFRFLQNQFIPLANSSTDSIEIKLKYMSLRDSIDQVHPIVRFYYDLHYIVNSDTLQKEQFQKYRDDYMTTRIPHNHLLNGINTIELLSYQLADTLRNSIVGIDYITVKGEALPSAYSGEARFGLNIDMPSRLTIDGFSNAEIVGIDENNRQIFFPPTESGFQLRAGTLNSVKPYTSLMIGDSTYTSASAGLHIFTFFNNTYERKFYSGNSNEAISYLNSLPDGALISLSYNGTSGISEISSQLTQLGANSLPNNNDSYSLLAIKGSTNFTREFLATYGNSANLSNFIQSTSGNNYQIKVELDENGEYDMFFNDNTQILNPILSKVSKVDLLSSENQAEILIITHPDFWASSIKLVDYYNKYEPEMTALSVSTDDIYNQFYNGRKSPHAIKEFLKYAYDNWQNPVPSYVVLLGDASSDPRQLLSNSSSIDYVPTYGYPVSDYWFTLIYGEDASYLPSMAIGRIPIGSNTEFDEYLKKIEEYRNYRYNPRPWMKRFLFLSGGLNADERRRFYNMRYDIFLDLLAPPPLGADTLAIRKGDNIAGSELEGTQIRQEINRGATWVNFLGHAAAEKFDMDGWQPNSLNNLGRYGVLSTLSCNTGAFAIHNVRKSLNERYLLEPNRGFIATLGSTTTGYVLEQTQMLTRMMFGIADTTLKIRRLGDLLNFAKLSLMNVDSPGQINTRFQFSLLGDPLLKFNIDTESDVYISNQDATLTNELGENTFNVDNEEMHLNLNINNYGYCVSHDFNVKISKTYINEINEVFISDTLFSLSSLCLTHSLQIKYNISSKPGTYKFFVHIDPDSIITENNRANNILEITASVQNKQLLQLEPLPNMFVDADKPFFRVLNSFGNNDHYNYEFKICSPTDDCEKVIYQSTESEIIVKETHIDWIPLVKLNSNEDYYFHATYFDKNNPLFIATPLEFLFKATNDYVANQNIWQMNKHYHFMDLNKNGFNIDIDSDRINQSVPEFDYQIIAMYGDPTVHPPVKRWANIEVGDSVFVDGEDRVGFNIVTIPISANSGAIRYRHFPTWGDLNYREDSTAYHMALFLRDSVSTDEYVIMANTGSSYRLQVLWEKRFGSDNLGSLASLKSIMEEYGSKLFDDIDDDWNTEFSPTNWNYTYAMIGRRNSDFINEKLIKDTDSMIIRGKLKRYVSNSSLSSKIIGPASNWNSIKLNYINPELSETILKVRAGNTPSNLIEVLETSDKFANLSELKTNNRYLQFEVYSQQDNLEFYDLFEAEVFGIDNFTISYTPAPEVAIIESKTNLKQNNLLRGTPAVFDLQVINLSMRTDALNFPISFNIKKNQDIIEDSLVSNRIEKNTIADFTTDFDTEFLDTNNEVQIIINENKNQAEFYDFNNFSLRNLSISEDTEKPRLKVKIDGEYIKNGDYIALQPLIEIELYDNSPLLITDSTRLSARLNGYYYPNLTSPFLEFESINDGTDLKAILRFIPERIEFPDVSLIVYGSDNSNNRDTLRLNLRTYLTENKSEIAEVTAYPMPFDDLLNFKVIYKAPEDADFMELAIYDLYGNQVIKLQQEANIGVNHFSWDGKSSNNATISQGTYYYVIKVIGGIYSKPFTGKIIRYY